MKVAVFVGVVLLMLSVSVFAETTNDADWKNDLGGGNGIREYISNHSHEYPNAEKTSKYMVPLGVEVDVTLYEMDLFSLPIALGARGEYDLNNGVWGAFAKVSINLSPMIKGFLGVKQ